MALECILLSSSKGLTLVVLLPPGFSTAPESLLSFELSFELEPSSEADDSSGDGDGDGAELRDGRGGKAKPEAVEMAASDSAVDLLSWSTVALMLSRLSGSER